MSKDLQNQHFLIFKTDDDTVEVDVRFSDETVWLTLDQMSALFDRNKSTISRHIKNIFEEGELEQSQLLQICNGSNRRSSSS